MTRFRPLFALLAALSLVGASSMGCEPSREGPEPGSSPASGSIAVTSDDERLLIASEDHGALLILDRETRAEVARVATGAGATHVVELDGHRAVVSNRYDHTVSVVDTDEGAVTATYQVGVEPIGLARVDDRSVAVVLSGEESLALINLDNGEILHRADLGIKDPRAVARLDNGTFVVSHLTAGVMSRVSADFADVDTWDMTTRNDFGPQVHANHLRSLTVSPSGGSIMVAHSQANADTVRAPIGEGINFNDDEFGNGGSCGYSGCATELGAVVPAVTEFEANTGLVLIPSENDGIDGDPFTESAEEPGRFEDCFDCGGPDFFGQSAPNPPSILNPFESRFTGVDMNNPTAVAVIDGGRGQMVVNLGTQNLMILRRPLTGTADDVVGEVRIGHGATGIALTHDGRFAYVWNQFDGSVTEIEVPDLAREQVSKTRFVENGAGEARQPAEFIEVPEYAGTTFEVAEDVLSPEASVGRKLFHDATDSRISANHAISCASCHPDGRADGRTWQFSFGPRNTPQLGGSILDTAPFHWPGDVETHRELNAMTVLAFMGGSGLDERSMDAIGAFIDTIAAAPSRAAVYGLSMAQQRGRDLFYSAETGCADCHAGNHFTDNRNWDVNTQSTFNDISSFQTPVLHGLSRSGPYLHDGSQLSLKALLENVVATDQMGRGSHLSADQLDDLADYLSTL